VSNGGQGRRRNSDRIDRINKIFDSIFGKYNNPHIPVNPGGINFLRL
jgi:hypothetical protein